MAGALLAFLAFTLALDDQTQKRWSVLVFALLAGGFLTKGPVALVLFGLPVLTWTAWHRCWYLLRRQAWATGMPLFLALVVPWFVIAEMQNPGFLRYFFINENFLRFVAHDYGDLYGSGHLFPRGAAAVMFGLAVLPWTPVGAWIVFRGGLSGFLTMLRDDLQSLLFFGFAFNVLFWCFARQLLPTYMMPMAPLFATWVASYGGTVGIHRDVIIKLGVATMAVW